MGPPLDYNLDQPWVRQPFDGDLDWALFQDYLTLADRPRTMRAMVKLGCPLTASQLESLAWEKGWSDRAELWDRHLSRVRLAAIETETQESAKDVARRHARLARKALGLAEKELDKYVRASNESDMAGLLTPRDLIRFLFLGVRTERLVIGEASDRVEGTVDVSTLSLDELRALREMQEKARAL